MFRRRGQRLVPKFSSIPDALQCISSITVGEIVYGAHKRPERREFLLRQLEQEVLSRLEVLSFDERAAREYGPLRLNLERQGGVIGEANTRIAAIALSGGLTIVTGNVRHFGRVPGLPIENWLA